jgi:hypothetical protein
MADNDYKHSSQTLDFIAIKSGRGVQGIVEWYYASTQDSGVNKPTEEDLVNWKNSPTET